MKRTNSGYDNKLGCLLTLLSKNEDKMKVSTAIDTLEMSDKQFLLMLKESKGKLSMKRVDGILWVFKHE
ncbi:MAG: hypothetical protein N5P05_000489 [Chroococcopsis gigantea SAG 12.99]|jgi:predicted nucleotide-binding protein (sugar kinase/HSP70/actin superfamily)|nr:hypothetical protein [Chroococcopsis gigantea SAG 12.99]